MSMNAVFVQVEEAELSAFRSDPSSVEMLFEDDVPVAPAFGGMTETMRDRVRSTGPTLLADALTRLDPRIRQQLEERLGRTAAAFAAGQGGDDILRLMEQQQVRGSGAASSAGARKMLSLEKDWHGVHYLLCGEVEPGAALLSRPVLGGTALGGDDEGFSGYGPARCFTAAEVAELAGALGRPGIEAEAAARFDPARMSASRIYPGWQASDADGVMDAFRRLRDFYADAASRGRAIVTCLV
jgi:hypothetical protein